MRVLVTDGRERAALAAVRSLGQFAEVFVASDVRRSLAGVSRFCAETLLAPTPLEASPFSDAIAEFSERRDIDLVLPVSDAASAALIDQAALFKRTRLAAPSKQAFLRLTDKCEVATLGARHGLLVPQGILADSLDSATMAAEQIGWPVVVKPARSVVRSSTAGARKLSVVSVGNQRDLEDLWRRWVEPNPVLIQRVVPGWGEGIFVLRWNGTRLAAFAHRRLREKPPEGGTSVLRESIAVNPARLRSIEAILDEVEFDGVAMAEFRTDGRSSWLMEFNARLWGSLQLAIDAGVDFPRLFVDAVLGNSVEAQETYRLRLRSRWLLGDVDHAIALARGSSGPDGKSGVGAAMAVLAGRTGPGSHLEVLRPNDPCPFLLELGSWLRHASVRALCRYPNSQTG